MLVFFYLHRIARFHLYRIIHISLFKYKLYYVYVTRNSAVI